MASTSRLFKPLRVGNMNLQTRVAMAPMTRLRGDDDHVPTDIMIEYYSQRASFPGTLLITEGTFIAPEHGGYANVPGVWNEAQITAWKKITDAVHAKGSFIVAQLWALGRTADPSIQAKKGFTVKSASAVALDSHPAPEAMTAEDIQSSIRAYADAAKNAIQAGFDAVEVHGANGYLGDQFLHETVNQRTDAYGGSIENRSRYLVEVVEAIAAAVGAPRTSIRLSPWGRFQGMHLPDPVPQFSDLICRLPQDLAYLHVVEPRTVEMVAGDLEIRDDTHGESNDFVLDLWKGPYLSAGGYTAKLAASEVDGRLADRDVVIVFGRPFIANPDLPFRIREGIEFHPYDRSLFYTAGTSEGYTDQPFSAEWTKAQDVAA